ncbi:DUF2637 domain-containing protein [Actinoallomurus spadix]|uniref:DUF2637 domain-containing protein n=1 Tax=Actinoallomurus spadix TaxID=79912 RepID=UPI0020932491|nr:DUF2637 domain-containing protein [Actinoallomurus spadix]MCO5987089.1 DUF2637 domain-containing protein [Actinoallomurus spadix]
MVVGGLVAALGLLGFVNSFARVAAAARASFGWFAFTVPIGIDLGIAVFSALDIVLARLDMRIRWLRLIPWSLTGATVYLNVAGEASVFGVVAHAVLPALWVAAVEVAAHVVRTRAGLAAGTRMDSIRLSRWLLAPAPTVRLWRRMVLWETRSYPAALVRERDRILALTDLKDTYGAVAWRWKAPRRTKALYKLGELIPAVNLSALPAAPTAADGPVDETPAPSGTATKTARRTDGPAKRGRSAGRATTRPRARSGAKRRTVPNVDELMPTGRRIAAELDERGVALTRDSFAAALREAGQTAGNERVGALLARLKAESAAPADSDREGVQP